MPFADPSRAAGPDPERATARSSRGDPSAIPSFLRERPTPPGRAGGSPAPTLPRPVNPPPPREEPAAPALDPASLPMPSLSRRRVVTAAGILVAGWLLLSFARQVGEATAASNRADELRRTNAELRSTVDHLQADLQRVQDRPYVLLAGRAVGLGGPGEIPFSLASDASPLPADAPGSASVRLGADATAGSPLEAWLALLFGPGR